MSLNRKYAWIFRPLTPCLALLASICAAQEDAIFTYHQDFRFLLDRGQQLFEIPRKVDGITPTLHLEVEIFAAADIRASAELLYTSTSMLLQQHATLVDVFTETRYFKEDHIRPAIEMLLSNNRSVAEKCERYLGVVRRPELFQQILNLKEVTESIETNLGKYRAKASDKTTLPEPKSPQPQSKATPPPPAQP
ncbi:MAG: hypothetical protein ABQ298_10920 [Puniceicoccaceae bacterium]